MPYLTTEKPYQQLSTNLCMSGPYYTSKGLSITTYVWICSHAICIYHQISPHFLLVFSPLHLTFVKRHRQRNPQTSVV